MTDDRPLTRQATCVAIGDRGILIEGPPGSGKSSLALALIDRGAQLVGDDGVVLAVSDGRLSASPHPRIRGLIEVRNLGLLPFACRDRIDLALVVRLDPQAPRFVEHPETVDLAGISLPMIRIWPQESPPALKVELALTRYGLPA